MPLVIGKEQARQLTLEHVQKLDLRGYRYEFAGISSNDKYPDEWGTVFDVYTPKGHLMDGPVVFVVERRTGAVKGYEPR